MNDAFKLGKGEKKGTLKSGIIKPGFNKVLMFHLPNINITMSPKSSCLPLGVVQYCVALIQYRYNRKKSVSHIIPVYSP